MLPPEGGSHGGSDRLIAAAAITGVAFSTHYYAIFLAIPLAWSAARGARDAGDADAAHRDRGGGQRRGVLPAVAVHPRRARRRRCATSAPTARSSSIAPSASLGYCATRGAVWIAAAVRHRRVPIAALLAVGGRRLARCAAIAQRTLWLLAFPVPFLLFIASTYPGEPVPRPAGAVHRALRRRSRSRRSGARQRLRRAGRCSPRGVRDGRTREPARPTRSSARPTRGRWRSSYIRAHIPAGATILTQPYSVPLEPTADVLREAVAPVGPARCRPRRGCRLARQPYPSPAYRLIYLGRGMDVDKLYLPLRAAAAAEALPAGTRGVRRPETVQ